MLFSPIYFFLNRLLPVIVFLSAAPLFTFGAPRTWTDTEGRNIHATPLGKTENDVRVRRDDGQVFNIPLSRLSQTDREWVATWEPEERAAASIEEAVLVIETPRASGSGFLLNFHNGVFVVTNQHVIDGASPGEIKITDLQGRRLTLGRLEVSPTLDLARIAVAAPNGLNIRHAVSHDAEIVAYGNSRGGGVATVSRGKVVGISQDVVEVSAEIVQGNSGGPVVDQDGYAIGVASFVTREELDAEDWVTKGTRYQAPRRFAIRLNESLEWRPVDWSAYSQETMLLGNAEKLLDQAVALASAILSDPVSPLVLDDSYPESIQEIIRTHNQHVRRFESNIGRSVSGHAAIQRANQSQNANLRARIRRIREVLDAELNSLRLGRPQPSTPYLQERLETYGRTVGEVNSSLEKAMNVERTFYRLR